MTSNQRVKLEQSMQDLDGFAIGRLLEVFGYHATILELIEHTETQNLFSRDRNSDDVLAGWDRVQAFLEKLRGHEEWHNRHRTTFSMLFQGDSAQCVVFSVLLGHCKSPNSNPRAAQMRIQWLGAQEVIDRSIFQDNNLDQNRVKAALQSLERAGLVEQRQHHNDQQWCPCLHWMEFTNREPST